MRAGCEATELGLALGPWLCIPATLPHSAHPAPAALAALQRRQELLRGMTDGDAVLLIGGDLSVTVEQAQGLWGGAKNTHPFARVSILEPFPTADGG